MVSGRLRSFCVHFTPLGANTLLHLRGLGLHDREIATADLLARAPRGRVAFPVMLAVAIPLQVGVFVLLYVPVW